MTGISGACDRYEGDEIPLNTRLHGLHLSPGLISSEYKASWTPHLPPGLISFEYNASNFLFKKFLAGLLTEIALAGANGVGRE